MQLSLAHPSAQPPKATLGHDLSEQASSHGHREQSGAPCTSPPITDEAAFASSQWQVLAKAHADEEACLWRAHPSLVAPALSPAGSSAEALAPHSVLFVGARVRKLRSA